MIGMTFFWLGLGAVAGFFLGVTLLILGLFAQTADGRRRLAQAQGAALFALLILTGVSLALLESRLAPFSGPQAPAAASAVDGAMREILSVLLLGLALTMNALLTAFAWVRLGRAGHALRALVWTLPAVRLVLACNALFDAFDLQRGADGAPDPARAAAHFRTVHDAAASGVRSATILAATLFLLACLISWVRRARRGGASAPAEAR